MPVLTRTIRAVEVGGLPCLGAVGTERGVLVAPVAGTRVDAVRDAFGAALLGLGGARGALVATLKAEHEIPVDPAELPLFAGKNVLVSFRNGESAQATADWLTYHAAEHGGEAALIVDRGAPESGFAETLAALGPGLPVVVVSVERPLSRPGAPDLRHPDTAPAAPRRGVPPTDDRHGPLVEHGIYELLRHRFLAGARAVAFLEIADLLLPAGEGVFARAAAAPGRAVPLRGREAYPWRLRRGQAAPHSDHIALRRGERRALLSWAVAPADCPAEAVWRPGQPLRLPVAEGAPAPFVRAMGVAYPGVPVNRLVSKSLLREEPGLVTELARAFGAEPIRLPAPATIPPRPEGGRVTVVSAMKNEGPFVLDWIAHNRAIGVHEHLVYTNDCDDGTERLLDLLAEAGVTRRDNPFRESGQVPQHAAFRAAESERAVEEADWLMTLDVDEYIDIHAGEGRIGDLLGALPEAHVVSMPWRLFGNADRHRFEDAPVAEQFPLCAPEYAPRPLQAWAFKTLYRNAGLFRRLGVHRPKGLTPAVQDALIWVDATGKPLPRPSWERAWRMSKGQWGYGLVTLNHYAVRSAESFLVKRERGKVNRTRREQGLAYWFRMNHNAGEDRSIARLAPRVAAEKAALLALPGVAEAHAEAVDWHRRRIAALLADPEYAALYAEITSPRMERLSRMTTWFGSNVHLAGPQVIPDEIAARDPSVPFFWTVKLA